MQFTFGDEREVYLLDESALPVTEKESMREGKRSIGPGNLSSFLNAQSFPKFNINEETNCHIIRRGAKQ